jgi:osmotically-inducible protein OsmY
VQANVSKKLADASDLSTSNITATVSGGTATVTGTVGTNDLRNRAERLVRTVRGVRSVDNQIVVSGSGNSSLTPPL